MSGGATMNLSDKYSYHECGCAFVRKCTIHPGEREGFREGPGHTLPLYRVGLIQAIIKGHSTPPRKRGKYKGHSTTDVRGWMKQLIDIIVPRKADHGGFDGNMRYAREVGMALLVWYVRLHRAKGMDPRRPIADRKKAIAQVTKVVGELAMVLFDDSMDPLLFEGQEWESPWAKNARDGKFV